MSLETVVKNYTDVMNNLLGQTDQLIKKYQNQLFKEEFDADRLIQLEEIGGPAATGTIDLTRRIVQPVLITGLLVSSQANQPITITIGRYSFQAVNTQSRLNIIAPVQYIIGPGDTVKMVWSGGTDGLSNYFLAYGKSIGSHFG